MDWKKFFKKVLGVVLIVYGFFALLTPLTPGAWLIFLGMELLGIEFLFIEKLKNYRTKNKKENQNPPQ